MVRIAINGFGRIGRMFFRAAYKDKKIKVVAINDLTDSATLAHLLKYDSVHSKFQNHVSTTKNSLKIGSETIPVFAEKDPLHLPWKKLKVDVVVESTGFFRNPVQADSHIKAGAKKVLVSAPCKCDETCLIPYFTVVKGVNDKRYNKKKYNIVSNASCTTNCVAPIMDVVQKYFGVKNAFFSTIHGYTSSQKLVDGPHKDLRRSRAAALNIIPSSTGADKATVEVLPKLDGKLRGVAYRVPVADGSVTDFVIETEKMVSMQAVNAAFKKESLSTKKGIIEYSQDQLVSTDIIGNPHSAIFDSKLTKVLGKKTLKVVAWYDNEWGYSSRLVDVVKML